MKTKNAVYGMLLLSWGALANAQAMPAERVYLDKGEVTQVLVGKVSTHIRASDSQKVKWDIRPGGTLYGSNLTGGSKDTARWEIKDDGAICLKWRGNSTDGCFYHFKSGDKLMRTERREPSAPVSSEILEIE